MGASPTPELTSSIWGIAGNWAEVYQACFVPTITDRWAPVTLALAAPRAGERVLDVACGTGAVTRHAAKLVGPGGRVAGVDLSPDMLAVARRLRRRPASTKIEWHAAPADQLPFGNGSFDIVTCQFGMMFFRDRVAALKAMRRVLAKGGRIAIATWGALEKCAGNAAMAQAWREHVSEEQASGFGPPHSLNDPGEVRELLRAAGFKQVEVCVQAGFAHFESPKALVCGYGALAGLKADAALRNKLVKSVTQQLKPYINSRGLRYPVEAVLAGARR